MSHNVTELALNEDVLQDIRGSALEGAGLLQIDPILCTSSEIITKINAHVSRLRHHKPPRIDSWTGLSLPLGSLWGEQLANAFPRPQSGFHRNRAQHHPTPRAAPRGRTPGGVE